MRGAWLVPVVVTMLGLGACASPAASDEDEASDGELAGGESAATDDSLTSKTVTDYAAVAPPEHRVSSASVPALVGEPLVAGQTLAVIRTAIFQGQAAKLVVDEQSLLTSLVVGSALDKASRSATDADHVQNTSWSKSLASVSHDGHALLHLSVTPASLGATEPFALTVDMCQSHKPWEKRLFDWAVALSDELGKPVPIAIAMTGVWAIAHPTELAQLKSWGTQGKLAITWVNHSSTHPLHCLDAACRNAEFLTNASVDFDEEVLGEERVALARGMAPSVLFRFPGLVHDARRLSQLARLSVMPLDADGWIAKGQAIAPGRVVLVHGNGNEPSGITGFLDQVESSTRASALKSGSTELVSSLLVSPVVPR